MIADLIERGKTVGVASTSHKAIHNVLDAVESTGATFKGLKKANGSNPESFYEGTQVENVTDSGECVNCDLAAGTAWHFSRSAHDDAHSPLIDEAAHVSLGTLR